MLRRLAELGLTLAGLAAMILAVRSGLWPALSLFVGFACAISATLFVHDRAGGTALAIASLLLGPFAGPVLLLSATGTAFGPTRRDDGADVPEPTNAERIFGEIAQGRRPLDRVVPVPSLGEVFVSGSLIDQQTALAAVARQYRPEFRPVLERALASDIPAVRVQAAAILAHLRDSFTSRARAQMADETDLSGADRDAEINALSTSGFIDAATIAEMERRRRPAPAKRSLAGVGDRLPSGAK
jgi:hypothetical protein